MGGLSDECLSGGIGSRRRVLQAKNSGESGPRDALTVCDECPNWWS